MKNVLLTLFLLISLNLFSQNAEDRWVDSVFNSLTIEQKVGQIMNLRANQPKQPFDDDIDEYIAKYNIGGVTFFRTDAKSLLEQANEWQSMAQTPLMIAIDGEWGIGMRINDGMSYPYQMTLGAIADDSLIAEMGRQIAEQCTRIGVNVNFAPDVDVNNEPENPVIGYRSFGEDPDNVARKGAAYAMALQNNGVLPSMKHFPGHGNTVTDSHHGLPVIKNSLEEIEKIELAPFKYLVEKGVKGAMVGHLYFPAIEHVENQSSSLSKIIVTDLLKEKMNYDGIIFTDGLEMKGAYNGTDPDSVCLKALLAGNDVLLLPINVDASMKIIIDAAKNDVNVRNRVEESCKKILRHKYQLGLHDYKVRSSDRLNNDLNQDRYYLLKQRLYNEAVTMLENKKHILPLNSKNDKRIAVVTFGKDNHIAQSLKDNGIKNTSFLFDKNTSEEQIRRTAKQLKSFDYVIVNIRNTSNIPSKNYGITTNMIEFMKGLSGNKIILNLFGSPYAIDKFSLKKNVSAILVGYEDNEMVANAIVDIILGKMSPKGKLPVSLKKYQYGHGLSYGNFLSPETLPVALIDNTFTRMIDSVVYDGIERKAFPGCQLLAMKDGKIIFDRNYGKFTYEGDRYVSSEVMYDVASLTKLFASTFALMKLYDDGLIDLNSTLGSFFPYLNQSDKGDVRLIEFLTHQSGMTPWIPIYKMTLDENKNPDMKLYRESIDEAHTLRVAENLYLSNDFIYEIYDTIMKSPLKEKKYKYSDIGFYFVPAIVEALTNQSFESFLEENFYSPLNLNHTCFRPLSHHDKDKIVPTENDTYFRKQLLRGDVHDQSAALFGGVSGHAGLFSNAKELAVMMQLLLNNGYANGTQFISKETIDYFNSTPFADNENRRGIGFDKPDLDPDAKYYTPSKQSSMRSFGHSGFTGTFAWADPENNLIVIFLSNRVYPDSDNNRLSELNIRTVIHDLFYKAVQD